MKTTFTLIVLLFTALSANAQTVLLQDDFNGSSINSSIWTEILPFGSSSLVESGGNLTTTGRGTLATVQGFDTPYTISGNFVMNSDLEHFNIMFRSDFSIFTPDASFAERNCLLVAFSNDGDQLSIQQLGPGTFGAMLALESFPLSSGTSYDFVITDTGNLVTVSVNGVPQLSANSTFASGDLIGFESREFSDTSTSVNSFQISSVPEPGMYALIFGVVGLGMVWWSKRLK